MDFGVRITPAYAGKTLCTHVIIICSQDHPRVCGKDDLSHTSGTFFSGSPPRMRERHRTSEEISTWTGITPAYAGKTL